MIESTTAIKMIALVVIWLGGSVGFYYFKYGKKDKIEIMSVANIERKYKRRNDEGKKSIF